MAYNQTKCGIIYKKIAMQVGDDERMINYEWPKQIPIIPQNECCNLSLNSVSFLAFLYDNRRSRIL